MLERLVVTQAVAQCALEVAYGYEEPIVRRPAAHHLPEPLDDLELRAVTRQPVQLDIGLLSQHRGEQGPFVPRSVIDYQHHTGVLGRRIGAANVAHMARKGGLQAARSRLASLSLARTPEPLHQPRGHMAGDQVEPAEDIDPIVAIEVAHDGPLAFEH